MKLNVRSKVRSKSNKVANTLTHANFKGSVRSPAPQTTAQRVQPVGPQNASQKNESKIPKIHL